METSSKKRDRKQPIINGEFVNPYLVRSQQRRYLNGNEWIPAQKLTSVDEEIIICDDDGEYTLVYLPDGEDELIDILKQSDENVTYFKEIDAWSTNLSRSTIENVCRRKFISFKSGHIRTDRLVEITRAFDGKLSAAIKKKCKT